MKMILYRSKNRLPSSKMCFRPWMEVFSQKCCKSRWFLSDDLLFILALRRGMMNSLQKTPKQLWHWFKRGRIFLFFLSLHCWPVFLLERNNTPISRTTLVLKECNFLWAFTWMIERKKKRVLNFRWTARAFSKTSHRVSLQINYMIEWVFNNYICLELFFDYGILSSKIRLID